MVARLRAPLALAVLALSALAAGPASASQSLECRAAGHGVLSCWDGKVTLRTATLPGRKLLAAASPDAPAIFVAANRACAPP